MSRFASQLSGLYALTDSGLIADDNLLSAVTQALEGGCRIVQYRDKSTDPQRRKQQALALAQRCQQFQACCIINDDVELANVSGADGVHLGKDDMNIQQARELLGPESIIGVSCYNDLSLAIEAERQGADYVAFGSFYASSIKPDAVRVTPALLTEAKQQLQLPIAAIGGIDINNANALIEAGADMLAVISAVFGKQDITAAACEFAQAFTGKIK